MVFGFVLGSLRLILPLALGLLEFTGITIFHLGPLDASWVSTCSLLRTTISLATWRRELNVLVNFVLTQVLLLVCLLEGLAALRLALT